MQLPQQRMDGITVISTRGNDTETLMPFPNNSAPSFAGAYEKARTYNLTVSKSGYKTYISSEIIVPRDCCHVIPQIINIVLQTN